MFVPLNNFRITARIYVTLGMITMQTYHLSFLDFITSIMPTWQLCELLKYKPFDIGNLKESRCHKLLQTFFKINK
jgi:hypothetical protein